MRVLIVSAVFPPHVKGGAEISAYNLAQWLVANGHEVGVFTTARDRSEELDGEMVDGLKTWRVTMPRLYTAFDAVEAAKWKKPIWHAQDMVDPRNAAILGRVLDAFKPDIANVHFIQGIGYNGLTALGTRNIPVAFTLHDLGLACVKMAMFVNGKECAGLCTVCSATAKLKMRYLRSIARIGFISPSQANLDRLASLQPIGAYPGARIPNPNRYAPPTTRWQENERPRLLFVGRLHESKGIHLLFEALAPLAERHDFTFEIVGSGPSDAELRARWQDRPWVKFTGHVSVDAVTDVMATSDLLFVPSIWLENSPGVIIQALGVSLPVMGSNKGGIPELVDDGRTGLLVEPGNVEAWRTAIEDVLQHPETLKEFRRNAAKSAEQFEPDHLGRQVVRFYEEVMQFSPATVGGGAG